MADVVVFAASHGCHHHLRRYRAAVTFTPPLGLSVSSGCLRCLLRRCCMTIFVFVFTTVTVIVIAQLKSSPRCRGHRHCVAVRRGRRICMLRSARRHGVVVVTQPSSSCHLRRRHRRCRRRRRRRSRVISAPASALLRASMCSASERRRRGSSWLAAESSTYIGDMTASRLPYLHDVIDRHRH